MITVPMRASRRGWERLYSFRVMVVLVAATSAMACSQSAPPAPNPPGVTGATPAGSPSAPPMPPQGSPAAAAQTAPPALAVPMAEESPQNQIRLWVLLPAAPHLEDRDVNVPAAPGAVLPGDPVRGPNAAAGMLLPWVPPSALVDDRFLQMNFSQEKILSQQARRHPAGLVSTADEIIPEPITKMESFADGLAEIKRRLLKAKASGHGGSSVDHEADMFDQLVGNASSVSDLVSTRSFQPEKQFRLLGLFGEHATEAVPVLIRLVRQHFETPERSPLGYRGLIECAQALANIGSPSADALKVLLREGTTAEKTFAIAVIGLLGEQAAACVPELLTLLDSQDPAMVDAALWGLAAVGPPAIDAVPRVVRALEQDQALTPKAAGVLFSVGPAAADETLKLVEAGPSPARLPAIYVLGTIGKENPRVVATLGRLLDESDSLVQNTAIVALAELGEAAKPVVPKLVSQLRGPHAQAAAKTLGSLGNTAAAAVPDLVQMAATATVMRPLQGHETHKAIIQHRLVALDAIASIGAADAASVTALAKLLQDPRIEGQYSEHLQAQLRGHVAKTLGKLGRAAVPAIPQLIASIERPVVLSPASGRNGEEAKGFDIDHTVVRKNSTNHHQYRASVKLVALMALGEIGDPSPSVLEICTKCLQDPDPAIRMVAAKALVEFIQPKEPLVKLVKETIRQHAYNANLAKLYPSGEPAPPAISYSPNKHDEGFVLYLAFQAAAALGNSSIPAMIEVANASDMDRDGWEPALFALAAIGPNSPEARLCLTRMSLERDSSVTGPYHDRDVGQQALASLPESPRDHVQALLQLVEEDGYAKSAIEALAKCGSDAAVAVPKLTEHLKSENVNLRIAVVKTLAAMGTDADGVQPALLAAMKDDEWRVRQVAFEGLCRMGPAAAPHAAILMDYASRYPGGFGGNPSGYYLANLGTDVLLPVILPKLGKEQSARQLLGDLSFRNRRRLKGEANAKLLASYLTDENVEVRRLVAGTLRMEMGEEARPVLDAIKKAARDKDAEVSWQACMLLLELLPLDEAVAAAPPAGKADPLKGKIDQVVTRLLAPVAPGPPPEETLKLMPTLRQEASAGYWVRSLKNSDPRVRFVAAWICQLRHGPSESVVKSVIEDRKTTPQLKAFAEQMLQQIERSRAEYGP